MNDRVMEVRTCVAVRDVFCASPDYMNVDLGRGTENLRALMGPCDTYEKAQANGVAMLAAFPALKRFKIEKWTERIDETWVDGVEEHAMTVIDMSAELGGGA